MSRAAVRRRGLVSRVVIVVWLMLVWVALWGEFTAANIAAGLLVAMPVVALFRGYRPVAPGRLRLGRALRYVAVFAWMLVAANVNVAAKVLAPRVRVHPAVVTVVLPPSSDAIVTLVANSVTLTPGTLSLEAFQAPDGTAHLVVHALDAPDPGPVRADVLRLHRLATEAFAASESTRKEDS